MGSCPSLQRAGQRLVVTFASFFVFLLMAVGGFYVAQAAPAALECGNVGLTAPGAGSTLSGSVEVRGRATVTNFQFFKVEYSPLDREAWVLIGTDVARTPVENGPLAVWQTTRVPDGIYRLRLRVVDHSGNYCEALDSPLMVANSEATPAPEETETPVLTAVPPLATVTVRPYKTLEVVPVQSTPGAIPTRAFPIEIPDVNIVGFVAFFLFGVAVMLAALVFVAVVFVVRRYG